MLDNEITRKLQDGLTNLGEIDTVADNCGELKLKTGKKLKYYKEMIDKAQKKQGKEDPLLNDKLAELMDELYIFERDLVEADLKIKDQKKKRADAKKVIEDINKAPEKFNPTQLDNMLANLEEI